MIILNHSFVQVFEFKPWFLSAFTKKNKYVDLSMYWHKPIVREFDGGLLFFCLHEQHVFMEKLR